METGEVVKEEERRGDSEKKYIIEKKNSVPQEKRNFIILY